MLVGSNTAKTGIELFMDTVPTEKPSDFFKPKVEPDDDSPFGYSLTAGGSCRG